MKFRKWIADQGGPSAVGRLLGLHRRTIYQWLWGKTSPRALTMIQIVQLSKGRVTFEDIIKETKKARK